MGSSGPVLGFRPIEALRSGANFIFAVMMEQLHALFGSGVQPNEMTILQMSMRAIVVFFAALILIRIADKRFMASKTGFDLLLVLVLGSTLSRAINGPSPLFKTIAIGFVVVLLHRALATLACRYTSLCGLLKGHSEVLIENGELQRANLARHSLTEADIREDMRLKTNLDDFHKVKTARLERNGEISVIPLEENELEESWKMNQLATSKRT